MRDENNSEALQINKEEMMLRTNNHLKNLILQLPISDVNHNIIPVISLKTVTATNNKTVKVYC